MSIIYEALKKVESGKLNNVSKTGNSSSGQNPAAAPHGVKTVFKVLIAVCVVGTMIIASGAYFLTRNTPSRNAKVYPKARENISVDRKTEKTAMSGVVPVESKITDVESATPAAVAGSASGFSAYNLQGIVYDENSPFAIINGKTLRKSDAIGDFIVVEIAPTIVTLKNPKDNEELTLSF